jgi:hypothetical protein
MTRVERHVKNLEVSQGVAPGDAMSLEQEVRTLFVLGGAFLGAAVGFLLRPANRLTGQLDLATVISRGTNLTGLDQLLKPQAETSFNMMLIGALIGAVVGFVASAMRLKETRVDSSRGRSQMNFQMLSRFVMLLGVVFLAYAGYQYATNQPEKFDSSKSQPFFGGRNDVGNLLGVMGRNAEREAKRKGAATPAMWGGILLFAGLAIAASTRQASQGGGNPGPPLS